MTRCRLDDEINSLGGLIFMEERNIEIELMGKPSRKEKLI